MSYWNPREMKIRSIARVIKQAAASLSLLLFVATIFWWVRSYWIGDGWQVIRVERKDSMVVQLTRAVLVNRGSVNLSSVRGEISESRARKFGINPESLSNSSTHLTFSPVNHLLPWENPSNSSMNIGAGFGLGRLNSGTNTSNELSGTAVILPIWSIVFAIALLPIATLWLWVRRRRLLRSIGRCAKCGYDLRATPWRCPECGAIPESSKA
jgi:hypothetical protein